MKKIGLFIAVGLIIAAWLGYGKCQEVYSGNTSFDEPSVIVFVSTGSDFSQLQEVLNDVVDDMESLLWVAEKKSFGENIKPGRYRFIKGMSNNEIINRLRSGDQEPVRLTFNSARTLADVAGKMASNIEADSLELLEYMSKPTTASKYGFNSESFRTMFIPNTYEVWWNTSEEDVVQRMAEEYKTFWSDSRKDKAAALGLSQSEVTTLASIVKAETQMSDEAPKVAGVYLNRIRKRMPLQADPTLVFALGNFTIKRVLDKHKTIDSPYNTYTNLGLPPGPINIPPPHYIDAVLNADKHDYVYFCAKPDFSGYHNFSKTYSQHLVFAREYQKELNKRRIYR